MPRRIRSIIKQTALGVLNIPYSRHGLPIALLPYLEKEKSLTMVDIGAHYGDFIGVVSKYSAVRQAILVEPIPELAHHLEQRFKNMNYQVINCAVSDEEGVAAFEVNDAAATSSLLKINRSMPELSAVNLGSSHMIQCQTRTLDDIFNKSGLDRISLLKIDVQGAEHLVLKGGYNTLKKVALVWIEVSFKPLYEGACTFFNVHEMLYNSGFILKDIEPAFRGPDGELLQSDALYVRQGA